ncbi:Xaa-Pro peptidase family protein [Microbacterium sp.]|uniref:M24 family metallopeptidase n=1 Tax=Microbacterium sp. TaxID=51671 RepID=UPI002D77F605|nr:Xaa-Pro peptidase family protein [Microbacterium sp.]HET6299894.1 Xaa-Pro peptidase family protein [Microbacterium sp.]
MTDVTTLTPGATSTLEPADAAERALRHRKLRAAMADQGLDAILAYAPAWRRENVRYLTDTSVGGTATFALLPLDGPATAYSTRLSDLAPLVRTGWVDDARLIALPGADALVDAVADLGLRRIGVGHLELLPLGFDRAIREGMPGVELVSATKLLDEARMVKSEWELERMRTAAAVSDAAWNAFVEVLEPGITEYDIVAGVEAEIKRLGAEDNFMLIASGKDEVLGMTPPSRRVIQPGDMVRTELTPQTGGYWLQICRSVTVGPPSAEQQRSFELFREAADAGFAVVKPGVTAHEVAVAENDVFRKHGLGEYCSDQWTRVRGHGVGLHLDETPIIEGNHTVLPEGATFIIHPNTFTPIAGYHVFGDQVVVTATGAEYFVSTERRLFSSDERSRR